jgi:hypothetical protein
MERHASQIGGLVWNVRRTKFPKLFTNNLAMSYSLRPTVDDTVIVAGAADGFGIATIR